MCGTPRSGTSSFSVVKGVETPDYRKHIRQEFQPKSSVSITKKKMWL
jgi:hypothetical protein